MQSGSAPFVVEARPKGSSAQAATDAPHRFGSLFALRAFGGSAARAPPRRARAGRTRRAGASHSGTAARGPPSPRRRHERTHAPRSQVWALAGRHGGGRRARAPPRSTSRPPAWARGRLLEEAAPREPSGEALLDTGLQSAKRARRGTGILHEVQRLALAFDVAAIQREHVQMRVQPSGSPRGDASGLAPPPALALTADERGRVGGCMSSRVRR